MTNNKNVEICKKLMKVHGCKTMRALVLFYASDYSDQDAQIIKKEGASPSSAKEVA
jgi:hypothetical protein